MKTKRSGFVISLLLGFLGGDWFYLSKGNFNYILTGFTKMILAFVGTILPLFLSCVYNIQSDGSRITLFVLLSSLIVLITTGNCIWWIIDWVRILTDLFKDGNGYGLLDW